LTKLEDSYYCIDMQIHAGSACHRLYSMHTRFVLDNPVTFAVGLLVSGSLHTRGLLWTMFLPSVVLIAQAVFILECRQTNLQMQLITISMP